MSFSVSSRRATTARPGTTLPEAAHSQHAYTTDIDSWLTPSRFGLFLALLVVLTFPGIVLGTRTFIFRDYGLFSYPVAFFQRECFWRGEVPLWNPYSQCGLPFLAQWNTMCLYPPTLFYLLLPLTWALPIFCLAHLVWGGLGMYLVALKWTNNRVAAGVAGVVFAFNGLSLNFLMWPSQIATFSWLPWLLFLAPLAWREGGRKVFWATAAGAMQMLAGGPEVIFLTWLVLSLLGGGDWWFQPGARRRIAMRFVGMVILIALVCAAQLLPFLELVTHSQRGSQFGSTGWAMPVWGWANLLVPVFRTLPTPAGVRFQPGQYWTSSYYPGIGTVLLVLVAVWRGRGWRVRVLAALLFATLLLALGNQGLLYPVLRRLVPVIGFFRYPVKFVILFLALAPLLAAVGLDRFTCARTRTIRFEAGCVSSLVLAIIAIAALGEPFAVRTGAALWKNAACRLGLLLVIFGLLVVRTNRSKTLRKPAEVLLGLLLLTAFWVDFVTHTPRQNPTASPAVFDTELLHNERVWNLAPALGHSRAMLSPAAQEQLKYHSLESAEKTYLLQRLGLLADCNLLEQIPQIHGFFSLAPAEINDVTVLPYVRTNQSFPALLDLMGVGEISAPGQTFAWVARPTAMPLVTAGQEPAFADDRTALAAFSRTNLDFRQITLLPFGARQSTIARREHGATAKLVGVADQTILIQTHSANPALVVIAQTWYPEWAAFVDGKRAKLWRTDYAFQSVQIPAGEHLLKLEYRDRCFEVGVVLSCLGAVLAAWVLLNDTGATA